VTAAVHWCAEVTQAALLLHMAYGLWYTALNGLLQGLVGQLHCHDVKTTVRQCHGMCCQVRMCCDSTRLQHVQQHGVLICMCVGCGKQLWLPAVRAPC
jgi:hypothetical protein